MNVKSAASNMTSLVRATVKVGMTNTEYGQRHLLQMIQQIEDGEITNEKAHRWLGYIQGVVVSNGGATLHEVKEINFIA